MEKKKTYEEQLNEDLSVYYDEKTEINKNKDFVQINVKHQAELMQLAIQEPTAMTLFLLFISRMERNNTYIVSKKELAECIHKSIRSIDRAINSLVDNNFLVIMKYRRNNVYFINPQVACSCSASQKKRLIEEYVKQAKNTATKDRNIIDLSAIVDNKSRLVLKTDFYKQHKELQKPNISDLVEELDLLEILNNMPREQILELKQHYATDTITEEEQKQIAENIERKQKVKELLQAERELDEQISREKLAKTIRSIEEQNVSGQQPREEDFSVPPKGFGPTESNPFGLNNQC